LAFLVLGAAASHASSLNPRLGLVPALVELPDGSVIEVPGPHIVLNGTHLFLLHCDS
jgi:hypothetical protein